MAVTPGTWALPPAKAESQQQPEVMGLSSGGRMVVTEPKEKDVIKTFKKKK
eukprot:TRINITY_DN3984_c0_g1_i1.p1 TRINITY_DN3984_c0_g1~~TRINITY_DN3984_c0_g1_i1.p1  ORF type:complete len:51 (-),score=12.30 TRINITY_DN3984_c0_g1_i1:52-204(-)